MAGDAGVQDEDHGGVVVQPAQALAAIETETGDVSLGSSSDAVAKLRLLLEQEVMAQACPTLALPCASVHSTPSFRDKIHSYPPVQLCAY